MLALWDTTLEALKAMLLLDKKLDEELNGRLDEGLEDDANWLDGVGALDEKLDGDAN